MTSGVGTEPNLGLGALRPCPALSLSPWGEGGRVLSPEAPGGPWGSLTLPHISVTPPGKSQRQDLGPGGGLSVCEMGSRVLTAPLARGPGSMPRTGIMVGISGSVKNCGHVTSFLRDESFTWRRHAGISTRPLLEVSCSWCASALSPSEARVTSPPCGRTTACPPSARPRRSPPRGCVKVCVRAALCARKRAPAC